MGWWGKYYGYPLKGKERIDGVIAEDGYNSESETHKWEVVDSALRGTTVYLAVRRTEKATGNSEVYAVVALTRNDNGHFMVKTMDETMLPYYYGAPKHLLDKLTPTQNESALEWRKKCEEARKPSELSKLPLGTKLRLKKYHKPGEWIVTVDTYRGRRAYIDWWHHVRFLKSVLEYYGYEIIKEVKS